MGLSRLDNFLKNTKGEVIYVDPSSLDATDSVENQGNSLARPFKTIQRALVEAARFSYQAGRENDRFGRTTILLFPGEHIVDNRPGWIPIGSNTYQLRSGVTSNDLPPFDTTTNFDLNSENNILYKLNSIHGGVIVPRGTSIVGLDLRKTKIRPKYVPNPTNANIERSAIFRLTGACYIWQFSVFDADPNGVCYKDYTTNTFVPNFSHHKLTAFEYADGYNFVGIDDDFLTYSSNTKSDLDIYYEKIGIVYGTTSGRPIPPETASSPLDIETKVDEYRIVGSRGVEVGISSIRAGDGSTSTNIITVDLAEEVDGLDVDTPIQIQGVSINGYNGQFVVSEIIDSTSFQYQATAAPVDPLPTTAEIAEASLNVVVDTVTSASPYVFNCSLRSVYGMCGLHADGDKADGFKSMVVAQFTGIGLQKDNNAFVKYNPVSGAYEDSTNIQNLYSDSLSKYKPEYESYHIKCSNNAFIQLVSVFAIGYAQHFLAESGGDLSITNSNSNFGAKSLVGKGFRPRSFVKDDVGYITHVIPPREIENHPVNIEFISIDVTRTAGVGTTSRLYLYDQNVLSEPPETVIDGYRLGAKPNDSLKLDIETAGVSRTYSSVVVMPSTNTSYEKISTVRKKANGISNEITADVITFTDNHEFENGETIRIISDTGYLPDGINQGQVYYAITTGLDTDKIKVAKTFNDALIGQESAIYSNENSKVQVISKVSDKKPGDIGHPIQWDLTYSQWYINVSTNASENEIFPKVQTLASVATPRTYFNRTPDTRPLLDKIYRVRYVIPKDNPFIARPPSEGYVIQESSDVISTQAENEKYYSISEKTLLNSSELRNFRFISNATYNSGTVTITTEIPHNLTVGTEVEIVNVASSLFPDAFVNEGYNGTFIVVTTPSAKQFTYTLASNPGTFASNTATRDGNLPYFIRSRYKGTYFVYRSEEVQKYIKDEQDGVYYLILVNASNKPTVTPFTSQNFSQPIQFLYPQANRDNPKSDPTPTTCFALPDPIGQVVVNNPENSITKETIEKAFTDFGVGIGLTDIVSGVGSTSHVLHTNIDHGFNRAAKVSIVSPGFGYGTGAGQLLYNASLVGLAGSTTGANATAVISIDAFGSLTGVKIIDGGSAYSVGDRLNVVGVATTVGFSTAVVEVTSIYNNVGDTLSVTGINPTYNSYNTLYRITGIATGDTKRVTVQSSETISGIITTGIGQTNTSSALVYNSGPSLGISSIFYVTTSGIASVTVSDRHGLQVDDKVKFGGATNDFYNGNFVVKKIINSTVFEVNLGITTSAPALVGTMHMYRNGFTSRGGVISRQNENISGRQIPRYDNLTTTLAGPVTSPDLDNITITNIASLDLELGDYLQINDEIMRVSATVDGNPVYVFRGVLGSRRSSHALGSVVRRIKPLPIEFRRNSIIRASGHTFEYLGFGAGNYSTAFPERQDRQLSPQEELLSQASKVDGGIVAFTAMNDKGDFYIGNKKVNSSTGKEEVFDAPIPTVTGEDVTSGVSVGFDIQTTSESTVSRSLRVEGGPDGNIISEFNGPVIFNNKVTSSSEKGIEVNSLYLQGDSKISRKHTTGTQKPTVAGNPGDVVYNEAPSSGGTLGWVYTKNDRWEDFGLVSNVYPLASNVGILTEGNFIGVSTSVNFIGLGVSITGQYDTTTGITTLTLFSSSVEPEYLYVTGVSTFQNNIIANQRIFANAGLIATTGVSTFNSPVKINQGVDIFNGASIDTLTVSGTVVTTDLNTSSFISTTSNFAGDISCGTTARSSNTVISALSGDNNNAGFEAYGDTQGTGYLYIGSRATRGGGLAFNGNLSPAFAVNENNDEVSFYRRSSGLNYVVFSYPYNSNDVTFKGDIYGVNANLSNILLSANASITGSISTVTNINSVGISTLPTINSNTVTVNSQLNINGPVKQNVVSLGSGTVIDCSLGNYFTATVSGITTFSFSNVPTSSVFGVTLEVTHNSGTINWPAAVKFPEDQAPILTTGKTHLFMFVTDDGGTRWRGAALIDYVN